MSPSGALVRPSGRRLLVLLALIALGGAAVRNGGVEGGAGPSDDATLAGLAVSSGTLAPAFAPKVTTYVVGPELLPGTLTVTAATSDAAATLSVNGIAIASGARSAPIPVPAGKSVATIAVVARDKTTRKTYTILLDRRLRGQEAFLKSPKVEALTLLGSSLAISGDTLAVGGEAADGRMGSSGVVHVFVRRGNAWAQQALLPSPNPRRQDGFGSSLAIEGDTLVVGAPTVACSPARAQPVPANGIDDGCGAVYVFVRQGERWSLQAQLMAPDGAMADYFGMSVALSGETVVVGAHGQDGPDPRKPSAGRLSDSGAAYVFVRRGVTWTQQACLRSASASEGGQFGGGLALDGNTLAVSGSEPAGDRQGERAPPGSPGSRKGIVHVFVRTGDLWFEQARLSGARHRLGTRPAISGGTLVVDGEEVGDAGPRGEGRPNGEGATEGPAIFVFVRTGTEWGPPTTLRSPGAQRELFGASVAIAGDTIVVGAPPWESADTADTADATDTPRAGRPESETRTGGAYLFLRSGAVWSAPVYLQSSRPGLHEGFGLSVAISRDTVVIGDEGDSSGAAPGAASGPDDAAFLSGAVYVFR